MQAPLILAAVTAAASVAQGISQFQAANAARRQSRLEADLARANASEDAAEAAREARLAVSAWRARAASTSTSTDTGVGARLQIATFDEADRFAARRLLQGRISASSARARGTLLATSLRFQALDSFMQAATAGLDLRDRLRRQPGGQTQ